MCLVRSPQDVPLSLESPQPSSSSTTPRTTARTPETRPQDLEHKIHSVVFCCICSMYLFVIRCLSQALISRACFVGMLQLLGGDTLMQIETPFCDFRGGGSLMQGCPNALQLQYNAPADGAAVSIHSVEYIIYCSKEDQARRRADRTE